MAPDNIWGSSNHSEEEVDSIMQAFLGIEEYVKMTNLPYDGIHHIDMHMKVLDENTILMGKYPEGIADGPQIEANLQYILENFKQLTGRDYNVIRIPMPPDQFGRYPHQNGYYRTYANAFFINKTVLVPTYEEQYDTTALRIWQEAMPGYNIVGIDCNDIIPAGGAIHCITKEIGVNAPLWMYHESPDTVEQTDVAEVRVQAKHRSGIAGVVMHASEDGINWTSSPMDQSGDWWSALVSPTSNEDTTFIYYYFEATANDGKVLAKPLVAPEGYYDLTFIRQSTSTKVPSMNQTEVRVFPNPASAITCIDIRLKQTQDVRVSLFDVEGRLHSVLFDGLMAAGANKQFFDAGALVPGIYLVRVEGEEGIVSEKVVVR